MAGRIFNNLRLFLKGFIPTLLIAAAVLMVIGAGIIYKIVREAPDIENYDFRPQGFASILYDCDGRETERLVMAGSNREEAVYEEIPEDLINAFIAVEDNSFWNNKGIDIKGIIRGAKGVVTGDSSAGGGSTITQQLIKNTVFQGGMEKTFGDRVKRKIQEWYLAVSLTKVMDKKVIMTNYLNTINLGSNTLGVKVAARRYFNKELKDLTLSECTVLAGITKNPSRLNPITGAEANRERRLKILDHMLSFHMISEAEYKEAAKDHVYDRIQEVNRQVESDSHKYTYFTDEVIKQVENKLVSDLGYSETEVKNMVYGGGLSIYTTQDSKIQQIADQEINNPDNYSETLWDMEYRLSVKQNDGLTVHYSESDVEKFFTEKGGKAKKLYSGTEEINIIIKEFKEHVIKEGDQIAGEYLSYIPQPQISFVLIEQSTGQVKALCGGRGEKQGNRTLNRATDTLRQPGSTFKVLTSFAPALDTGKASLATVYYDGPYRVGDKSFRNWYNNFTGHANIREGIVYSMNIVAVRCLMETVSPDLGISYAEKLGIHTLTENDHYASAALGGLTDGVSNLELTAAYAAIANKGIYTEPVLFTKVTDHNGRILLENKPKSYRALKETTSFLLTDALSDGMKSSRRFSNVSVNSLGVKANLPFMSCGGKSGTTTSNKDIWFVGFTPYYTAGIWSGNDKNQVISGETSFHKNIWRKIMEQVHNDKKDIGFPVPKGIVSIPICRKSGKLALDDTCENDPRGTAVYNEYFVQGTEPKEQCDRHIKAEVCTDSGKLAGPYCVNRQSKVFLMIDEKEGSSDDTQYDLPGECAETHGQELENSPITELSPNPEKESSFPEYSE